MTLPRIEATGRLGADPELKFTGSGKAVANFRIACDDRRLNKQTNEWETTTTVWLAVDLWEKDAEAAAEHLKKGDEVTVIGQLNVREFDRKDGGKGTSVEIKYSKVSKALPREKSGQASGGWSQPPQSSNVASDPWATASKPANDEPPF